MISVELQKQIDDLVRNFNPPAAKFVWKPHPSIDDFDTLEEHRDYWKEEAAKWKGEKGGKWENGVNGLSNFEYFWYREWWLKDGLTQNPIRPLYREDDHKNVFNPLAKCEKNRLDFMLMKRREAIWSSVIAALCVWKALTESGGEILYTSANMTYIQRFFEEKLIFGWERLVANLPKNVFNFEMGKNGKAKCSVDKNKGFELIVFDKNTTKGGRSATTIRGIESVLKPKSFASSRAIAIIIDEAPMHPKLEEVRASANGSRMYGGYKTGLMYFGGSCGEMHPNNFKSFPDFIHDAENKDIVLSEYMGYEGIFIVDFGGGIVNCTINGYTNHELAKLWISERRKKLEQSADQIEYWGFVKSYPIESYEFLQMAAIGSLPEDIKLLLVEQKRTIKMNEKITGRLYKKGSLFLVGEQYKFIESEKGFMFIIAEPRQGGNYCAGTDPLPFSSANPEGSSWVTAIKDLDMNEYVAFYIQRLADANVVIGNSMKLQKWYNNAPSMCEVNTGSGSTVEYYKAAGCLDLLCASPTNLDIKYTKLMYGKGYTPQAFGDIADSFMLDYAKNFSQNIKFDFVIDEYMKWGTGANVDILDGMRGAELYHRSMKKKAIQKSPETKMIRYRVLDGSGAYVIREISVLQHKERIKNAFKNNTR